VRHLRSLSLWQGLALVAALTLGGPQPAAAQLTPAGAPTLTGAGVDMSDVAYDEINGVYLHVFLSGTGYVQGRFVNGSGAPVGGAFVISTARQSFAGWPSVAYSTGSDAGVFFVMYASDASQFDKSKNVWGQIVRFNGAGGELAGGAFAISPMSTVATNLQESGGIAFNPFTKQFLATWTDLRGNWDVFARLFNTNGTAAGNEIDISAQANFQGAPNVAFDWINRRYLAVWKGETSYNASLYGSWGRLLDENAQPLGPVLTLGLGGFQDVENVVFLPEAQQFLTFWRDEQRRGDVNVVGRLVSSAGALTSIFPILATTLWEGVPDGDYNWSTRSSFVAVQSDAGYIWGAELNGTGQVTGGAFQASHAPLVPNGGHTWPHVITGPSGQFGLAYAANYNSSYLERLQRPAAATPGPRPGSGGGAPETPITIDLTATAAPNGSWFFAEGASSTASGFKTYYLLTNENEAPVTVRAYFSDESGHTKVKDFSVAAHSRSTPELQTIAGDGAYGSVFQSLTPGADIFVERSIYWGPAWEGSTGEVATKNLSSTWYFAEGSRGGEVYSNFFLLYNPTQTPVNATITFSRDYRPDKDSTPVQITATIPAQTRVTVDANGIPALAGRDFATSIVTSGFIVAERAMYWGPNWLGGTASLGAPGYSKYWYFAEGTAAQNFESFYLLFNPNPFDITVYTRLLPGQDSTLTSYKDYAITVKANSRHTFYLNGDVGAVGGVGSYFISEQPFLAERSMYWGNYLGSKLEGTNVVGSPIVAKEWHLPEGTTGGAFTTYLLAANPTPYTATVNVTLFIEANEPLRVTLNTPLQIAPNSRVSLNMADVIRQLEQQEGRSFVGLSFSTRLSVQTSNPQALIVAEHSIYWNPAGPGQYWHGGSGAMGIPR
jgi:hypothetical protein